MVVKKLKVIKFDKNYNILYNVRNKGFDIMNDKTAFALQGGGALGAYQAGACHALIEKGINPDWLVGISIGALNSAIIAGNKPEDRIKALSAFWKTISSEETVVDHIQNISPFMTDSMKKMLSGIDNQTTILKGQKGFFKPNKSPFSLLGKLINQNIDKLSYYNTSELKETLLKYADFDLINNGKVRVSIGVVEVESGEFMYFDNTKEKLTPEHFMASGALPPGFPAVKINDKYYWDGGISNNSAITKFIQEPSKENWKVYQIDLWRNEYQLPQNFDQLNQRLRDIQFSSKNNEVDNLISKRNLEKESIKALLENTPESLKESSYYKNLLNIVEEGTIDIKRIVYQGMDYETKERPYQFGINTIKDHWENGYHDMQKNHLKNQNLKL